MPGYHTKNHLKLTPREQQILQALIDYPHISHQEVANKLNITYLTLKTHLHNAYSALSVNDCRGAIIKASQLKLITLPDN